MTILYTAIFHWTCIKSGLGQLGCLLFFKARNIIEILKAPNNPLTSPPRLAVHAQAGGQDRKQHLCGVWRGVQLLLHLPHRVGVPGLRLRPVPLPLQQRAAAAEIQWQDHPVGQLLQVWHGACGRSPQLCFSTYFWPMNILKLSFLKVFPTKFSTLLHMIFDYAISIETTFGTF